MRKKLLLLLITSLATLVGCSNNSSGVLSVKDGIIYNNGKAVAVKQHNGSTAVGYASTAGADILFETHMNFNDCNHNLADISESQVTKYEGIEYFTMYLSSCITAHKKINANEVMCASMVTSDAEAALPVLSVVNDIMKSLDITTAYTTVNFEEKLMVKDFSDISVTPEYVSIPDILVVRIDATGALSTSGTAVVNGVTVGVNTADDMFDYYKYGTVYVKAYKGVDISRWIYFN